MARDTPGSPMPRPRDLGAGGGGSAATATLTSGTYHTAAADRTMTREPARGPVDQGGGIGEDGARWPDQGRQSRRPRAGDPPNETECQETANRIAEPEMPANGGKVSVTSNIPAHQHTNGEHPVKEA